MSDIKKMLYDPRVEQYRRKYLKDDRFKNIYITKHVVRIDKHFKSLKEEPLLPLKPNERLKYIRVRSFFVYTPIDLTFILWFFSSIRAASLNPSVTNYSAPLSCSH